MSVEARRAGIIVALITYGYWGVAPVYFKWLASVDASVIIAHRVLWALGTLIIFLRLRDGPGFWRRLRLPGWTIAGLGLSGTLVAGNWLIFVYAVTHERILETSLGYFINPLVNVILGVLFLGERMRIAQWIAVALAAAGTLYLALEVGTFPWVALSLAFSFGFYGLMRKQLKAGPLVGLTWETALLAPAAIAFLVVQSNWSWEAAGGSERWLLAGSGLVTILPLVGFAFAAQRLPLSLLGFIQYLAPTISFLIAVFVYDEPFGQAQLVAFVAIWLALVIFSASEWLRRPRPAVVAAAEPAAGVQREP